MFTGIVREVGRVSSVEGGADGIRLMVDAPWTTHHVAVGDSVSVAGCCLTVVAIDAAGHLGFDAVSETLERTALGRLTPHAPVNLEPALRAGEPFGGHYVQGHVDGLGAVREVGADSRLSIDAPAQILHYVVEKGSITVDGVSLTVAALYEGGFVVALVPHTLEATTLGGLAAADPVNLEVDVIAKYVERLLPS